MFYKIGKKLFLYLINSLRSVQISLIFLSFFTILYWLLDIAKVAFVEFFTPCFNPLKDFVHLFYTRTVKIDEISIDFSFLIIVFIFLFIAWIMNYIVEWIEFAEIKYDKLHNYIKNKEEEVFNQNLEYAHMKLENKQKKILILIKFSAVDLTKDSFYTRDTQSGVEEKEKESIIAFWEILSDNLKFEETFFEKTLLLYFDKFGQINDILLLMESAVKQIKSEYRDNNWQLHHHIAIDAYSSENELIVKAKNLKVLLTLDLKDEVLCFATFKQRYLAMKNPKFSIEEKGVYCINENQEEVFCVKKIK